MGHSVISFTAVSPTAERRLRVSLALTDRKLHLTCWHDTVFFHEYWGTVTTTAGFKMNLNKI